MSISKTTVGLVKLANISLVIDHVDYLTITQAADLDLGAAQSEASICGYFQHGDQNLPAYELSEKLLPTQTDSDYRFCLGMKCDQQEDSYGVLCNDFSQVDLAAEKYSETEVPEFMFGGVVPVSKVLVIAGETYLHTSAQALLTYIQSVEIVH